MKTSKEVVNIFKKNILRHPPSPTQRNKVLKELKSLNNKNLVASSINKFSDKPELPIELKSPETANA